MSETRSHRRTDRPSRRTHYDKGSYDQEPGPQAVSREGGRPGDPSDTGAVTLFDAGAAPGVDRMIMLLTGEESIREVITFPMNQKAQDVMMDAPTTVTQKQLDEVHIAVRLPEED